MVNDEEEKVAKGEKELLKNKQVIPNSIEAMIMKIISAMNFIGFEVEKYSIEDVLLCDLSNINAFYKGTLVKFGDDSTRQRSYEFLVSLFSKYGGRTLFDVLEKIYGEEAKAFDTNLQVELIKEIRKVEALEKELVIGQGIRDLVGN
jgi:hypothetical protein